MIKVNERTGNLVKHANGITAPEFPLGGFLHLEPNGAPFPPRPINTPQTDRRASQGPARWFTKQFTYKQQNRILPAARGTCREFGGRFGGTRSRESETPVEKKARKYPRCLGGRDLLNFCGLAGFQSFGCCRNIFSPFCGIFFTEFRKSDYSPAGSFSPLYFRLTSKAARSNNDRK